MANNKVVFGNEIIMDLTEDTVTEDKVLEGETFHDKSGVLRSGSLVIPVQDVEVNGESVVDENGIAEVVVPVSGDVSTTDSFESYTGGRVKSVQMELSPIQDLHGYPEPWVGGSRKNKLPLVIADIKTNNTAGTWSRNVYSYNGSTITVNTDESGNVTSIDVANTPSTAIALNLFYASGTFPFDTNSTYILNGCPSGGAGTSNYKLDIIYEKNGINNVLATDTGSGASANFNALVGAVSMTCRIVIYTNASLPKTFYPMLRLSSVTDASFEPYENKCPISAHTQAKLEQRGKNLFNPSNVINGYIGQSGGAYKIVAFADARTIYARCEPNTTYTISKTAGKRFAVGWSDTLPNIGITVNDEAYDTTASVMTLTTGATAKYIVAFVWLGTQDSITADEMLASCQIELGSSATDYEPYQGKDYVVNLGGSYYWLRGDVVSGKWYVVGQSITFNGTEVFAMATGTNYHQFYISFPVSITKTNIICDSFTTIEFSERGQKTGIAVLNDPVIRFCFKDDDLLIFTLEDFSTWLSTHNVKVIYPLATPIPIDLDPQQIEAFLGENNFSAPLEQQEIIEIIARNIAEFNEVIDDENISEDFTYSSEKIEDRLDDFVDKDAVEEKSTTDEFSTINGGLLSSLKVSLSPNQDLHGYLEPWVGGAGKNKVPLTLNNLKAINTNGTWSGNDYTYRGITYSVLTDDADNVLGIKANGQATQNSPFILWVVPIFSGTCILSGCPANGSVNTYHLQYSNYVNYTYEQIGTDVSVTQFDAETYPNARMQIIVNANYTANDLIFTPMLRASGTSADFEPYSNICPISGHTEAKAVDDGFNRWNEEWELGQYNTSTGVPISSSTQIRSKSTSPVRVVPNTEYCFTNKGARISQICWYDADDNFISNTSNSTDSVFVTTSPNNARLMRFQCPTAYGTTYNNDICVNVSDSRNGQYVPYNGYQITVNLGGTYYSGTLDVVSGVFVPDTAEKILPSDGWLAEGENTGAYTNYSIKADSSYPELICSESVRATNYSDVFNNDHKIGLSTTRVIWHESTFADVTALMNYLSNNTVQIVHKLATPTPIQLSPTMVKALVGENHLSAPLEGQEITESKYRELFTWDEVEEIAQKIADSKIDNIYTSYNTTFSSAFTEARYVKKIYGAPVLTALQIVLSGAPSITFNHQLIFSDSQTCCELIQFGSGARIGITDVVISQGSVTFTFDSPLTKAIGFRCRITNDFVS